VDGSAAIVRGALSAGCDFFAGYPITPASPILMSMLRELPKIGGTAIQAEDEIASIGICIGAVMAGARALTATSGPGISLCSENIGLAIMGEVPLVIVDVQRLGPSTGAATAVGQGDIQFVRWGTGGGYPIIALAPSNVTECYSLTRKAFDLAERFRCPVFLMTDKELNLTTATVDTDTFENPPVRDRVSTRVDGALPYAFDPPTAVPPLAQYDHGPIVRFTGSTHDEGAYITKDPLTTQRLNEHLRAKVEDCREEIELVTSDLEAGASTLFLSYGVTAGAMREAVANIRARGNKISALTVQSLWPVPETAISRALRGIRRVVVAELNLGQYRREIERMVEGVEVKGLNRVDGRLLTPSQFEESVR
jgi:2-oxoglutarate ferredoxin oxidoreductase subunit alpha